jgi:hypothetical protein
LRKKEDTKRIFEIKEILSMRVTIEALRRSKLILQCKNCQAYGHTQKHCNKEARCVKCVGKHHTKECLKPEQSHPKCVNCGEAYPANYRGRVIAKELQKIRNSTIRRKTENTLLETEKRNTMRNIRTSKQGSPMRRQQDVTVKRNKTYKRKAQSVRC